MGYKNENGQVNEMRVMESYIPMVETIVENQRVNRGASFKNEDLILIPRTVDLMRTRPYPWYTS